MSNDFTQSIKECNDIIFNANNELMAIAELLYVNNDAALKMSEWGRDGLASILNSISARLIKANAKLPDISVLENVMEQIITERAASIVINKMMNKPQGDADE